MLKGLNWDTSYFECRRGVVSGWSVGLDRCLHFENTLKNEPQMPGENKRPYSNISGTILSTLVIDWFTQQLVNKRHLSLDWIRLTISKCVPLIIFFSFPCMSYMCDHFKLIVFH